MNKNTKLIAIVRRVLIVVVFLTNILLVSCTAIEQRSTSVAEVTDHETVVSDNEMTPVSTTAPIAQISTTPSPIPSATVAILEITGTPTAISSPTPTATLNSTVEATSYSTDIIGLEPISPSDPTWSAIIQRVNELDGFYSLALSPNGKLLAAVDSYDESSGVYLWDLATGEVEWSVYLEQPLATSELVFSPDGTKLAIGTDDVVHDIFVWDVASGNQLYHFLYEAFTTDMRFSPDSKLLAVSGINPGAITIWNLQDQSVTEIGRGLALDFIPDSTLPLIAVAKGQRSPEDPSPVYILNLQNGQKDYVFTDGYFADSIAVSSDGQYLATVISDENGQGNLRVLNLHTNEELQMESNEPSNTLQTQQIIFSTQGHLAVLQRDLTMWSIEGELLGSLSGLDIRECIFVLGGSFMLTYGNYGSSLRVWSLPPR